MRLDFRQTASFNDARQRHKQAARGTLFETTYGRHNLPYATASTTFLIAPDGPSLFSAERYLTKSEIVIISSLCVLQNCTRSGTRAMAPSSLRTSQSTPKGRNPARRARSTDASV